MDARISLDRRAAIAKRPDGSTSMIEASAIQNGNELAYAVRFLTDHFVYKRSKALDTVNLGAAKEAREALVSAIQGLEAEVMGQKGASLPPVSPVAEGKVGNPWHYVRG